LTIERFFFPFYFISFILGTGEYKLSNFLTVQPPKHEVTEKPCEVDVMVMPTVAIPAFPIGSDSIYQDGNEVSLNGTARSMILLRNTQPMNWAGIPAISIPAGLTSEGLPVGMQLAGAGFQEPKLLSVARVIEKLIRFDTVPSALKQGEKGNHRR
jgi:Asp-tRNA(Asn)/Glu-tRNA(Gln) amidotransferase A subunit family amidase